MPAHHPWVIRKAIGAAVYTLTDTTSFCRQIAPGLEGDELNEKLKTAAKHMFTIFDRTETLFNKEELSAIP